MVYSKNYTLSKYISIVFKVKVFKPIQNNIRKQRISPFYALAQKALSYRGKLEALRYKVHCLFLLGIPTNTQNQFKQIPKEILNKKLKLAPYYKETQDVTACKLLLELINSMKVLLLSVLAERNYAHSLRLTLAYLDVRLINSINI